MKKYLSAVILVVYTLMLCSINVSADTSAVTHIVFDNNGAVAEENLSLSGYGDKNSGYANATTGGRLYASVSGTDLRKLEWSKGDYGDDGMQAVMTGGTKNPWGNGAYLELRVSTKGYQSLCFSASIGATNKGPRDFKLQYSTDGSVFRDIPETDFSVAVNKTLYPAFDHIALPSDADDRETVYIRIAVASNIMVNGTAGLIGSVGGEVAINHVILEGDPIVTTTSGTTTTSMTFSTTTQTIKTTTSSVPVATTTASPVTTKSTVAPTTATVVASASTTHTAPVDTGEDTAMLPVLIVLISSACVSALAVVSKRSTKF